MTASSQKFATIEPLIRSVELAILLRISTSAVPDRLPLTITLPAMLSSSIVNASAPRPRFRTTLWRAELPIGASKPVVWTTWLNVICVAFPGVTWMSPDVAAGVIVTWAFLLSVDVRVTFPAEAVRVTLAVADSKRRSSSTSAARQGECR